VDRITAQMGVRTVDAVNPAHIWVDRREIIGSRDESSFDRVEYALRLLRMIQPPGMTVVVCCGVRSIWTEQGRDIRRGPGARWGIVSIPRHASRVDIAVEVAKLAGRAGDPFVLQMLLSDRLN